MVRHFGTSGAEGPVCETSVIEEHVFMFGYTMRCRQDQVAICW